MGYNTSFKFWNLLLQLFSFLPCFFVHCSWQTFFISSYCLNCCYPLFSCSYSPLGNCNSKDVLVFNNSSNTLSPSFPIQLPLSPKTFDLIDCVIYLFIPLSSPIRFTFINVLFSFNISLIFLHPSAPTLLPVLISFYHFPLFISPSDSQLKSNVVNAL